MNFNKRTVKVFLDPIAGTASIWNAVQRIKSEEGTLSSFRNSPLLSMPRARKTKSSFSKHLGINLTEDLKRVQDMRIEITVPFNSTNAFASERK